MWMVVLDASVPWMGVIEYYFSKSLKSAHRTDDYGKSSVYDEKDAKCELRFSHYLSLFDIMQDFGFCEILKDTLLGKQQESRSSVHTSTWMTCRFSFSLPRWLVVWRRGISLSASKTTNAGNVDFGAAVIDKWITQELLTEHFSVPEL